MTSPLHTPQQLWRTEFNKQATTATMEAVFKYAHAISRQVEAFTRRRDPMSVDDRVHAAIIATLEGRRTWNPGEIDLARHLISAIKTEITHELRHARRFPQVSLDDESKNTDDLDARVTDALAAQRAATDDDAIAAQLSEALAQLRVLVGQDKPVLQLLDAYAGGHMEKQDVLASTGMSARTYHNARQRLVRLAKKLPIEVRETAILVDRPRSTP